MNIPRDFLLNTLLLPIAFLNRRRIWEFAYGVEQVSFALFVLADLIQYKPDIVWTKEAPFAHVLYYARAIFRLKFKILFANGGGFKPATYAIFDHIQQLEASAFEQALDWGVPREKMTIVPNALPDSKARSFPRRSPLFLWLFISGLGRDMRCCLEYLPQAHRLFD